MAAKFEKVVTKYIFLSHQHQQEDPPNCKNLQNPLGDTVENVLFSLVLLFIPIFNGFLFYIIFYFSIDFNIIK